MGYGFLEFENKDQVKHALETLNGKPLPKSNNKTFKLNYAVYNSNKTATQNPNEFSIYVCELDPSVTEEVLNNFFKEKYKSVISSKIIVDPSTKISKGYGFVKFSDKSESEKAISEMNGKSLNGKPMKTGTASYKKNEKKGNDRNVFNDLKPNMPQDPNLLLQQQPYLNQFYLANGYCQNYYNPFLIYSQLLNQLNSQQNPMNLMGQGNMEMGAGLNNLTNVIQAQQGDAQAGQPNLMPGALPQYQGQDLGQLFGSLQMLQGNLNLANMAQGQGQMQGNPAGMQGPPEGDEN